jgi:hypothetical protein
MLPYALDSPAAPGKDSAPTAASRHVHKIGNRREDTSVDHKSGEEQISLPVGARVYIREPMLEY